MTTVRVKVQSSRRFGACTFSFTEGRLPMIDRPLYTVKVLGYKFQALIWQRDDGEWYHEVDTTKLPSSCYDSRENFGRWTALGPTAHVYCRGGYRSALEAWRGACQHL